MTDADLTNRHMRWLSILALCLFIAGFNQNGVANSNRSIRSNIPTVNYCDLIRNPKSYDQKEVRVRAVFQVGYEWQELYCLECFDLEKRTWVEFSEDFESRTQSTIAKKVSGTDQTLAVVLVGKFYSSDERYGHMGAYRFKLVVDRVEKAKVLLKDGRSPALMPKKILKGTQCATLLV